MRRICAVQHCSPPQRLFLAAYPICERQRKAAWATRISTPGSMCYSNAPCYYMPYVPACSTQSIQTSTYKCLYAKYKCLQITEFPSRFQKNYCSYKVTQIPVPHSPRNPNPGLVNVVVGFENAIVTIQGWLRQHLDLAVTSCLS